MFLTYFRLAIAFLPGPIQAFLLAVFGIFVLYIVFKLIALVLDAIPFL